MSIARRKPNVIIRLGAANWDAQVRKDDGSYARFDFRRMTARERSDFHREFMNAFRASRRAS